jgi:hypothetical protein
MARHQSPQAALTYNPWAFGVVMSMVEMDGWTLSGSGKQQ